MEVFYLLVNILSSVYFHAIFPTLPTAASHLEVPPRLKRCPGRKGRDFELVFAIVRVSRGGTLKKDNAGEDQDTAEGGA